MLAGPRGVVRASDKPVGKLYVSVIIGEASKYRYSIDKATVEAVTSALAGTGKIVVFTDEKGGYTLRVGENYHGIGLTNNKSKVIFYFDQQLANACASIREIVSNAAGSMECRYWGIPPTKDDEINMPRDFLEASGLDMEVVL